MQDSNTPHSCDKNADSQPDGQQNVQHRVEKGLPDLAESEPDPARVKADLLRLPAEIRDAICREVLAGAEAAPR